MIKELMDQNRTKNEKGGNKKGIIICFLSAALVVAITIIGVMAYQHQTVETSEPANERPTVRGVVVSSDNADKLAEEMATNAPKKPGYYTVAMTTGWHFENAKSISYDARVKNKVENSNDVYFDLFLTDDRENPIYMSPVISLGAELDQISLSRELPKGEYKCVMVFHLVDENQNTVDTLEVGQRVIIEN